MKSIWKYILGTLTFIGGILALVLSGKKKNQKVKELKKGIKNVDKSIKDKEKQIDAVQKSLESKKEALKEIEKTKYKKMNLGKKEASDFLKKYASGRNNE